MVEDQVREALIRLNPEIAQSPNKAEEVLHKLRAIILSVRDDGLVKANEEFTKWLKAEQSMPFGENGQHVTIRLIDFEDLRNNRFVVTRQYTYRAGSTEKRADIVLLINGLPLVIIEAKTPVRSSESWFDGASQIHDDYEKTFRNSLSRTCSQLQPKAKNIAMEASVYHSNIGGPGGWKKRVPPNPSSPLARQLIQCSDLRSFLIC